MLDSSSEAFQNVSRVTAEPETEASQGLVGTLLAGRYRIERLLGSGGMGAVYRAEHVLMRKACAVKVLHPEMTQVPEVVARFEREAVAAARIEHPNVAAATDFGQLEDGSFYLVLEFIEGQSLSRRVADEGILPEERALLIARQIAEALAAAHAAGIIHRDLKPDNVMLVTKDGSPDFVKVLDFGIAKLALEGPGETQQVLTRLNTVMGTPEYMAPEQARGDPADARADIYTVGAILFEMLSGTSPFRHEEFVVVLSRKLTEDAPALPASVSAATQAMVAQLLRRSPDERPQSAAEVVLRIDAILGYSPAPASLAFAPISGQLSRNVPKVAELGPAHAHTLVALPAAAEPAWPGHLRQALERVRSMASVTVPLGAWRVPLGWVGGALLGLPLLLALGFSAAFSGAESALPDASVSAPPPPETIALAGLMKRAEQGEGPALDQLAADTRTAKSSAALGSLGRGYFKLGKMEAGLRAYRTGAQLDAKFAQLPQVVPDVRSASKSSDALIQGLALELAVELGPTGADLLYEIWDGSRATNAALAKQAKRLLDGEAVQKNASPALKVALDLPKAKAEGCSAVKKLLGAVLESGDARSLPTLSKLTERRGCGFLGLRDCFGCLRTGQDFAKAQKAAAARAAPRLGS